MYLERVELYKKLENIYQSKVILYATSDRIGMETQIAQDVIDYFIEQLNKIGVVHKISLILYTRGGDTAAAWNIINLIKMYCEELEVIVPHKAHSAGTIISLGANKIIMTKQATLGPIDPSINTPLNPKIMNNQSYPVSVEAVKGYLSLAKEELGIKDDLALSNILLKLSEMVHPLVLGQVYRTKSQITMLAKKLLPSQVQDAHKIDSIINFLCSESGSHDYTINRREAKDTLGLNVEKPTQEQYQIIEAIYQDIKDELLLTVPFDIRLIDSAFIEKRAILESVVGGSIKFITEGKVNIGQLPTGQQVKNREIVFEGWRYDEK